MEGLQDLGDLLNQYDWREVASVGIGATIGIIHAVYDKHKERKRESSGALSGGISGGLAGFNATEGFLRGAGNGFLGGLTYILIYNTTYKILDKISKDSSKK